MIEPQTALIGASPRTSPDQTRSIGMRLATELRGGDMVLLRGSLGAGKTMLTSGIATCLHCFSFWRGSPTFAIVNEYVLAPRSITSTCTGWKWVGGRRDRDRRRWPVRTAS